MLKKASVALCVVLIALAAHGQPESDNASTSIYYGRFKLEIPTASLANAKIFSVDGPVIKFSDSVTLGGTIITRELLQLPEDFNLALYPRYIFGLESTDLLSEDLREQFNNALRSFGISEDAEILETPYKDGTVYSACAHPSCLFFATQHAQNEHLLMLFPEGFAREEILNFMGVNSAE